MAEETNRVKFREELGKQLDSQFKDWAAARQPQEEIWQRALDNFLAENAETWKTKDAERTKDEDWRSDVFIRLTKMKVVIGAAFLNDTMLQGGKVPFMLKPVEGAYPEEERELAQEAADKMTEKIQGQFDQCRADRVMMKCNASGALYGGSWIEVPVYKTRKVKKWEIGYQEGFEGIREYGRYERVESEEEYIGVDYKSVWSMFQDPESDDPHEGRGVYERFMASPYDLRQLQDKKDYDAETESNTSGTSS